MSLIRLNIIKLLISGIFFPVTLMAQSPGSGATLDYINSKLGKGFEVKLKGNYLTANYYENGKDLFREDLMHIKDIDVNGIYYNKSEQMMIINCIGQKSKCVDRQLHVQKIRRRYGRISFYVKLDDSTAEDLTRALKHLIQLTTNSKYTAHESFE